MTLDEFIDALAETRDKLDWITMPASKRIRARVAVFDGFAKMQYMCPIEAVEFALHERDLDYLSASHALKLSKEDRDLLAAAADLEHAQGAVGELRQSLLNAVGLTVKSCL